MTTDRSRRDVLRTGGTLFAGVAAVGAIGAGRPATASSSASPRRVFPISDYGGAGDGTTDCTTAFAAAIAACHAAGGGRVLVPAGRWVTGAIHLLSGVDLHVDAGATLLFSTDPRAYLPVVLSRWQGIELYNYSPLIYANGQRNISVTGSGVLDAQSDDEHWWFWIGSGQYGWKSGLPNQRDDWAALEQMGADGVPPAQRVFGDGHYLRPSFIGLYNCVNVAVQGVTLRNSPMWNIQPVYCRGVTVDGVTVDSPGPNGDGCDPDSSRGVVIRRSTFATHDDCIAIKSGRDTDGARVGIPARDILVEDCTFISGGGAVAIGSEVSGGVSGVTARRLRMPLAASLDEASVQWVLSVKSTSSRGGYIRDVRVTDVDCPAWTYIPFEVTFTYEGAGASDNYPAVAGLSAARWKVGRSQQPYRIIGVADAPVRDVRIADCVFDDSAQAAQVEYTDGFTARDVTVRVAQ
ncbi:MAG TPA: glycoside hydrolase family 28 protein [Trebonia sp.]|nr:glycoside hydrolase family 28 protein [Trebonia sp.]